MRTPKTLTVTIEMVNDAFHESKRGWRWEAYRILLEAAKRLVMEDDEAGWSLRDANGNTVGRLEMAD